jgi:hypothetical protein
VWIVPPALALATVAVRDDDRRAPVLWTAAALVPAALFIVVHAIRHRGAGHILTASGAVVAPSLAAFGILFVICASAGAVLAMVTRCGAIVAACTFAVLLEAAGLYALGRATGSASIYLPLKMVFLLVPTAAVLAALTLARVADATVGQRAGARWTTAVVPLVAAVLLAGRIPAHRQHGSITEDALSAGEWAREHVPPACVDYFSRYWLTGYWLHLDVLGNPRESERMHHETFEFRDSVGKWIEGRGLPFAFVEDYDSVPRDARVDMAILERFGRAAIVRNRRPAPCTDASPPVWQVR